MSLIPLYFVERKTSYGQDSEGSYMTVATLPDRALAEAFMRECETISAIYRYRITEGLLTTYGMSEEAQRVLAKGVSDALRMARAA